MIGDKVRKLRLQLGLSQQQLAGKEMSRVFISLVELNKSSPSPENLRIIAQRLGKPVGYFLHDDDADDFLCAAIALLEDARRDLANQDGLDQAYKKVNQVLKYLAGLERLDLEADARLLLIQCLLRHGNDEAVLEECERAEECLKAISDGKGLAQVYRTAGSAAFRQQNFPYARRAYEKALLYTSGPKHGLLFRMEVLKLLGSTLFRLGAYDEAIARYQEALEEAESTGETMHKAEITMGLGWAYYRAGQVQTALKFTREAAAAYRQAKSPDYVLATHNLAIIETDEGNWETAYVILKECLQAYREQGRLTKQASVYEDLARYWFHRGDFAQAKASCWAAIDILDLKDSGVLRGRLYRFLGHIAVHEERLEDAHTLYRMSYEILRLLKASGEMCISQKALAEVRHKFEQGGR